MKLKPMVLMGLLGFGLVSPTVMQGNDKLGLAVSGMIFGALLYKVSERVFDIKGKQKDYKADVAKTDPIDANLDKILQDETMKRQDDRKFMAEQDIDTLTARAQRNLVLAHTLKSDVDAYVPRANSPDALYTEGVLSKTLSEAQSGLEKAQDGNTREVHRRVHVRASLAFIKHYAEQVKERLFFIKSPQRSKHSEMEACKAASVITRILSGAMFFAGAGYTAYTYLLWRSR